MEGLPKKEEKSLVSDISIYIENPEKYSELQNMRPDYRVAIEKTISLIKKYFDGKGAITLVDCCGGTGNVTKKVSEVLPVTRATIVDINEEFLKIAQSSGIKAEQIETIQSDILKARLEKESDLVLSVFAYHHLPDNKKENYLQIIFENLKKGGLLVLTEIYIPNKELTKKYYEKLLNEIPEKNPILEKFLNETADSSDFEFKVSKEFADTQLKSLGFQELENVKIWPLDGDFSEDIGTFVQVFRK